MKLETLTDEQWATVHATRDRVIAETVAPGPADRGRVEAGIAACYAHLGLAAPRIVWVDGPLSAVIAANLLKQGVQLWDQLGDQLWDQLGDQLGGHLGGHLRDQLWDQLWGHLGGHLGDQLRDQLWDQLRDQLGDQLGGHLGDQLRGHLWDQLGGQLGDQLGDQLRGVSYDAWWLHWAHHWLEINRLVDTPADPETVALTQAWVDAHSASAWVPYRNIAIISDRHTRLTRDAEGRLHSEGGKAAWEWADGTAVYAHHGRRVEPWVVSGETGPERITLIDSEENIEVRRCAIERYGWGEYVADAGWSPVAVDDCGELFDVPGETGQRVCVVVNGTVERDGTQRKYGLLCRDHHSTPLEAVAASYGVTAEQYRSLERRT